MRNKILGKILNSAAEAILPAKPKSLSTLEELIQAIQKKDRKTIENTDLTALVAQNQKTLAKLLEGFITNKKLSRTELCIKSGVKITRNHFEAAIISNFPEGLKLLIYYGGDYDKFAQAIWCERDQIFCKTINQTIIDAYFYIVTKLLKEKDEIITTPLTSVDIRDSLSKLARELNHKDKDLMLKFLLQILALPMNSYIDNPFSQTAPKTKIKEAFSEDIYQEKYDIFKSVLKIFVYYSPSFLTNHTSFFPLIGQLSRKERERISYTLINISKIEVQLDNRTKTGNANLAIAELYDNLLFEFDLQPHSSKFTYRVLQAREEILSKVYSS